VVLSGTAAFFHAVPLTVFLLYDFAVRAAGYGQLSILKSVAKGIKSSLKLYGKMTREAPKRFAAGIGTAAMAGLLAAQLCNSLLAAAWIGSVIILLSALEAVFKVCVGCLIYQQGQALGLIR
jgi:hypothetical protein